MEASVHFLVIGASPTSFFRGGRATSAKLLAYYIHPSEMAVLSNRFLRHAYENVSEGGTVSGHDHR